MSKPAKYPPTNTKLHTLARFLVGNAVKFEGKIPIAALFEACPGLDRDWIGAGLERLRSRYSYYCSMKRDFIWCALSWPDAAYTSKYTIYGMRAEEVRINLDPRLNAPPIKFKYRKGDDKDTLIHMIRTYVLRHRAPNSHILDAAWLFQKYTTRRVLRCFASLNHSYGFHIRKLNPGKPDKLWVVDRDRNFQISTDAVLEAYKDDEQV